MLSDELRTHAAHFSAWAAEGGIQMYAHLCGLLASIFTEAAATARQMECQPIPEDARRPLPPGVVDLCAERARRRPAPAIEPGSTGGSVA